MEVATETEVLRVDPTDEDVVVLVDVLTDVVVVVVVVVVLVVVVVVFVVVVVVVVGLRNLKNRRWRSGCESGAAAEQESMQQITFQ